MQLSCKYRHLLREGYLRMGEEYDGQAHTILDSDTSQWTEESVWISCFLCLADTKFILHTGSYTDIHTNHSPIQPKFHWNQCQEFLTIFQVRIKYYIPIFKIFNSFHKKVTTGIEMLPLCLIDDRMTDNSCRSIAAVYSLSQSKSLLLFKTWVRPMPEVAYSYSIHTESHI